MCNLGELAHSQASRNDGHSLRPYMESREIPTIAGFGVRDGLLGADEAGRAGPPRPD